MAQRIILGVALLSAALATAEAGSSWSGGVVPTSIKKRDLVSRVKEPLEEDNSFESFEEDEISLQGSKPGFIPSYSYRPIKAQLYNDQRLNPDALIFEEDEALFIPPRLVRPIDPFDLFEEDESRFIPPEHIRPLPKPKPKPKPVTSFEAVESEFIPPEIITPITPRPPIKFIPPEIIKPVGPPSYSRAVALIERQLQLFRD